MDVTYFWRCGNDGIPRNVHTGVYLHKPGLLPAVQPMQWVQEIDMIGGKSAIHVLLTVLGISCIWVEIRRRFPLVRPSAIGLISSGLTKAAAVRKPKPMPRRHVRRPYACLHGVFLSGHHRWRREIYSNRVNNLNLSPSPQSLHPLDYSAY